MKPNADLCPNIVPMEPCHRAQELEKLALVLIQAFDESLILVLYFLNRCHKLLLALPKKLHILSVKD
ncbi:MAG: hypothetical protein J6N51_12175 [Selenomonas sp.]|nr:hypothetical protein [Selenomonas sp.]